MQARPATTSSLCQHRRTDFSLLPSYIILFMMFIMFTLATAAAPLPAPSISPAYSAPRVSPALPKPWRPHGIHEGVASSMARCANDGTVVGTVSSWQYAYNLVGFANAARSVGFPCVVVSAMDDLLDAALTKLSLTKRHNISSLLRWRELFEMLPQPSSGPLLPSRCCWIDWCGPNTTRYGWRRSQLYRVRLWKLVLEARFDLLALDLDWRLRYNPVLHLHAARAMVVPGHGGGALAAAEPRPPPPPHVPVDVVAFSDGTPSDYASVIHTRRTVQPGMLNVGLMWIRSTEATRKLAEVSEARTWAGWEQLIFNKELNFNFREISCCHSSCMYAFGNPARASAVDRASMPPLPSNFLNESVLNSSNTSPNQCAAPGDAASGAPPKESEVSWVMQYPSGNASKSHVPDVEHGRCTVASNVCVGAWRFPLCNASEPATLWLGRKGHKGLAAQAGPAQSNGTAGGGIASPPQPSLPLKGVKKAASQEQPAEETAKETIQKPDTAETDMAKFLVRFRFEPTFIKTFVEDGYDDLTWLRECSPEFVETLLKKEYTMKIGHIRKFIFYLNQLNEDELDHSSRAARRGGR